jgi:predicted RNA-binding Zn-ribbon protein involved in translation (DUF1610 family)
MRCRRCYSVMAQTHQELGIHSEQSWFKCPTCGRSQLVSRPVANQASQTERAELDLWAPAPISISR